MLKSRMWYLSILINEKKNVEEREEKRTILYEGEKMNMNNLNEKTLYILWKKIYQKSF